MSRLEPMSSADLIAARMLAGLTRCELAAMAGCSVSTIDRLESGLNGRSRTQGILRETFRQLGIRRSAEGCIQHIDGRTGLSQKAVGRLNGERLRRARRRLGLTIEHLADQTGLSSTEIRMLEVTPRLNDRPTLRLYRLVGALEHGGYRFRIGRRGGRSGDFVCPRNTAEPLQQNFAS